MKHLLSMRNFPAAAGGRRLCLCRRSMNLLKALGLASVFLAQMGQADEAVRTQTLNLQAGWNAVYLEVYPEEAVADLLFADTPIDMAAVFSRGARAQFTSDPSAAVLQEAGWGIWRRSDRLDAFLNTLTEIQGQQAYLVHVEEAFEWRVRGQVLPAHIEWRADAYNLVGCGVDPVAGPTFAWYFAGSSAHDHNRVYRLIDGAWRRVTDPNQATIRSGEAFWIYCDGPSEYQGPMRITLATRQGLVLGEGGGDVKFLNVTEYPLTAVMYHVPTGPSPVPLAFLIQVVGQESSPVQKVAQSMPNGSWAQVLPTLEAGQWLKVPIKARRESMTASQQTSLLRITTDLGTETWLPVVGLRPDLEDN